MATITCAVEASYAATAGDRKISGIPHEQHVLAFVGNGKGKGRRLGGAGSHLLRRRRTNVTMQVFVRTLAGSTMALDVRPSDTVDAVKAMIEAKGACVAAAEQRLVFAGRALDDGRRTLAEYGVRGEANLFLHLRLRGGAGGDDVVGSRGGAHWATAVGVLSAVVAVAAALAYFPEVEEAGTGGLILVLLLWAVAVAGVNLIIAGVFLTGVQSGVLISRMSAFVRLNLGVLGIAGASSAATGVILSSSDRALCFSSFALLLVAMTLVTIRVATLVG